jgi:hypothetical protein
MNQHTRIIRIHSCGECPYTTKTVNGYKCTKTGKHLNKTNYIQLLFLPDHCPLKMETPGDNVEF